MLVKRSKELLFIIIGVPLIIMLFLVIVMVQQQRVEALKTQNADLLQENQRLEAQNKFYKRAYEATLDDIKQLSKIYGGQSRYEGFAARLREEEISSLLSRRNLIPYNYTAAAGDVWGGYVDQGIVDVSCLPSTSVSAVEEVLLIVTVNNTAALYIDGAKISTLSSGSTAFRIRLSNGLHELDLVGQDVALSELSLELVAVPSESIIGDAGSGWALFDCQEAAPAAVLTNPGALRVFINKE
jgi:hypothetical protein